MPHGAQQCALQLVVAFHAGAVMPQLCQHVPGSSLLSLGGHVRHEPFYHVTPGYLDLAIGALNKLAALHI